MSESSITALVTGASSGLGAEFCRQLAPRCDRIIAVARRVDRLGELADELRDQTELHALEADLATVEGVARTMEALRQKGPVEYLVNNAGFCPYGFFSDSDIESQRGMVSLHVDATITLCRAAVPFMREMGRGHIINVSSIGAMMPGKGLAVYGATKAFLNYFSSALQQELAGSGIEVQALCPGYTRTEFILPSVEAGMDPSRIPESMWMETPDVVADSLAALGGGQVVVISGEQNRALVKASMEKQLQLLQ